MPSFIKKVLDIIVYISENLHGIFDTTDLDLIYRHYTKVSSFVAQKSLLFTGQNLKSMYVCCLLTLRKSFQIMTLQKGYSGLEKFFF